MQPQFSQGTAPSHHTQPYATPPEISQPNSGSVTSSLRQWRKKDYVDKPSPTENLSTSTGETISHIARVAPHTYYPRPNNDVCHYQHQFTEYSSVPYKQQTPTPVKYSEIVENQTNPAIEHISPIIKKQKEKEFVDLCGTSPQSHMKQYQDHIPLKQPYADSVKQQYGDPNIHHQYLPKEPPLHAFLQKQPQLHSSQYVQKDQFQQYMPKYNMQAQYAQSYPESNNFLAHLSKINPRMAQSIINDTHLRESQLPMYHHNIDQSRSCQQPQRIFHGAPLHSNSSHPHRSMPQPYNYSQSYNYNVKPNIQPNDPYPRIQQYQHPKYIADYKINIDQPNMPSQRVYSESIHMNYPPMPPKVSPNYSQCAQLEYAQHYQHRRSQMPQEFYPGFKTAYIQNHQASPEENDPESRNRKTSLKQFLENWVEEDISGNLPDIIVSNNLTDMENIDEMKGTLCIKNSGGQEQPLYVLDTTEIPNETLPHFLHLQQFEKLPDNIRGYYHSTNSLPAGSRRIIIENNSGGSIMNGNNTVVSSKSQEGGVAENCSVIRGGPENLRVNQATGRIERVFENQIQNVENKVVQIHIIESSEQHVPNAASSERRRSGEFETVIIQANSLNQDLTNVLENENCVIKKLVVDGGDKGNSAETVLRNTETTKHPKNMPVIDEVLQDGGVKEVSNDKSETVKENSAIEVNGEEDILKTNISSIVKRKGSQTEVEFKSKTDNSDLDKSQTTTKDIEEDLITIAKNSQIQIYAEDLTEKDTKDDPKVVELVDSNISDSDAKATDLSINNSNSAGDKEINIESKDSVHDVLPSENEKCDLVHTDEPKINERNDDLNLVIPTTSSTHKSVDETTLEEDIPNSDERGTEVEEETTLELNKENSESEVCEKTHLQPAEPTVENTSVNDENANPIIEEDNGGSVKLPIENISRSRFDETGSIIAPSLVKPVEQEEFESRIKFNPVQSSRELADKNNSGVNTPIFDNESDDFVDDFYDNSSAQTPKPLNLSMDRKYYEPVIINNNTSNGVEKMEEENHLVEESKAEPILKVKVKKLYLYEKHKREKKREDNRKKLFKKKRDRSMRRKLTLIESDVKAKLPRMGNQEDYPVISEKPYFEKLSDSEVLPERETFEEKDYVEPPPNGVIQKLDAPEIEVVNESLNAVPDESPSEKLQQEENRPEKLQQEEIIPQVESNNLTEEIQKEIFSGDSEVNSRDKSEDLTPDSDSPSIPNVDENLLLKLKGESNSEKVPDVDEKSTFSEIAKCERDIEHNPFIDEKVEISTELKKEENDSESKVSDENVGSLELKKVEGETERELSIDEKLESMHLRVDSEETVCDDTPEVEHFENINGCESKDNEIEETLSLVEENQICIEDKELIVSEKIMDPICTESVTLDDNDRNVEKMLEENLEEVVEDKQESVEEAKAENSEGVGGNEPGIVYQINDTNVVLQIADELLEINITEQNGKKVIFVKTFSNADVIMNNIDENDNQTCESIVCADENDKPIEDELDAIINNDDVAKVHTSELCEDSEIPGVIDDFCIFNEEIVSSSTEVEVVPKEKPVEISKKSSSKKDATKKSSRKDKTLSEKHGSRKLSCLNNPSKGLPRSDSKKLKLVCENLSKTPKTFKTKAALKYLETTEISGKSSSEQQVPSKTVKSVSFVENSEVIDKKVKKASVRAQVSKETVGILKTDNKNSRKGPEPNKSINNVQAKKETVKTVVANKICKSKEKRGSIERSRKNEKTEKSSTSCEKINKSLEKTSKIVANSKEVKVKLKTAETDTRKIQKQPRVSKAKQKVDGVSKEKKNIKVRVKSTEIIETVLKNEEIVKNVTVKVKKEISEKVKKTEKFEIQPKVEIEVEPTPQISVQENSITSSTCQEHDSVSKEVSTKTLLQNITDDWEEESEDFNMTDSALKRKVSLEEYNKRKLGEVEYETEKIIELNKILPQKEVREKSPESPLLNVNFSNKTYSRSVSNLPPAKLSEWSDESSSKQSEPLSSAIELQLPKVNRSRSKQMFSQEYLRKALLNDLHTVNAYTVSLIKENQQLMQRFLEEQRLTIDELKKVKKIIRYKRLVQHLSTIKITEMNNTSSRETNYKASNFLLNTPPLPDLPKFEKVSQVQPINLSDFNLNSSYTRERTENVTTEKRKRKRFRFLYSDDESTSNNISNSNTKEPVCDKTVENDVNCKKTKLETSVPAVDYSVHPSNSQSQLTLVFKRNFKSDPKMQPYVKIERLASLDLLAKNIRF